jgi:hypothetical protein
MDKLHFFYLKGNVQRDLRGGLTLHHSIGLTLRMSCWAFKKNFIQPPCCIFVFFVNPFTGLLYKKGGVFWIIWHPLKFFLANC